MKNLKKLNVGAFEVKGYCKVIDSLSSYFDANFSLLDSKNYRELFNRERPVYTKVRNDMPVVYGIGSKCENSLIADGCIIEGTVENSIIFRGVKVGKGAVIKNAIILQDTYIGSDVTLNCVITDKNVVIGDRKNLSGCSTLPYFIQKGTRI